MSAVFLRQVLRVLLSTCRRRPFPDESRPQTVPARESGAFIPAFRLPACLVFACERAEHNLPRSPALVSLWQYENLALPTVCMRRTVLRACISLIVFRNHHALGARARSQLPTRRMPCADRPATATGGLRWVRALGWACLHLLMRADAAGTRLHPCTSSILKRIEAPPAPHARVPTRTPSSTPICAQPHPTRASPTAVSTARDRPSLRFRPPLPLPVQSTPVQSSPVQPTPL